MKAVIIAGGLGTRLRPLTYNVPKPIVPIVNIPLVIHQINLLRRHGIKEIILNLHYLSDEIKALLEAEKDHGCKIYYSMEETPLGTAGAVKNAEEFFDDDLLVVLNGDVITDLNLSKLIDFHKKNKATATISLTPVEDPTPFGLVITDKAGRVTEFIEKPAWERLKGVEEYYINAGTYVLDPKIFRDVPAGQPYMFEHHVFPSLLEKGALVYGFRSSVYWIDIGNPKKYRQAHESVLRGEVAVSIAGSRSREGVWIGDEVEIDRSARLFGPSMLGNRSKVSAGAILKEFSILGDRIRVGEQAEIEHAIIWQDSQIGAHAKLKNCILGRGCRIEDHVRLEGAVIGDNTIISRGSIFNV